jgi:hypothetical protein
MLHHPPLPLTKAAPEPYAPEDQALALILITAWAVRTGRVLRPVPISELSPAELVEFWADDQLEDGLAARPPEWPAI